MEEIEKIPLAFATRNANYFIDNCLMKTVNTPNNIYQKRCRTIDKLKSFIEQVKSNKHAITWKEFDSYQQLDHHVFNSYIKSIYSTNTRLTKLNEISSDLTKLYLCMFNIQAKRFFFVDDHENSEEIDKEVKPFALQKKVSRTSFDYIYGISYGDSFIKNKEDEGYKDVFPHDDIPLIKKIIYIKYEISERVCAPNEEFEIKNTQQ